MKSPARRILSSVAVLAWSAVVLYFYASGRISHYLAADFRPIALAGGLGLAVLGLFNLLTAGQPSGCCQDEPHDHESGEMHPLTAFLLMLVPVALSVAWTRDEYSVSALDRKGLYDAASSASGLPAITREEIENRHSKTADGFFEFSLMDLFFGAGDREIQTALAGLKVETEGRWMDEKTRNPDGTRQRLYRLFITCCAADSRVVPVILEFGKKPPDFPENTWVKVAGTMSYPLEGAAVQPVLVVERVAAASPPDEESFTRKKSP